MRRTTEKIDDLARRAFADEPGANASFANRLRMRLAGERAATAQRNTRILVGSIVTAVAASVVILLVLTVDWSRPVTNATAHANTPVNEVPAQKDGKQGEHAEPRTDGHQEPRTPANTPDETPKKPENGSGAPSAGDPSTGSGRSGLPPKPEEIPKPEVKPQSKPEEKPQPKPEEKPTKPDEVEKPKDEPKTGVKPVEHRELGAVLSIEKAARAKIRYADAESWRDLASGEKLLAGAQLQTSAAVDFTLGAAQLRFDGEITLDGDEKESRVELRKDSLYADNLALKQAIAVTSGELRAELQGAAVFDISSSGLRVDVLHGRVKTGDGEVGEGLSATLSKRGLSRPRVLARSTVAKVLKGLPARAILREDFDREPAGGLYGGLLKAGFGISKGGNDTVAFKFEPRHVILPGEVIRVRYRVSKAKSLLVQCFNEARNDNFGYEISTWKNDEWQTLEFKPTTMLDRASGRVHPEAGADFVNFQFHIEGPQEALLEIDWIEIVRVEE